MDCVKLDWLWIPLIRGRVEVYLLFVWIQMLLPTTSPVGFFVQETYREVSIREPTN